MIPIVYGKKQKKQRIGQEELFCEICQARRTLEIYQFSTYSHLYWIPTSKAEVFCTVGYCTTCRTSVPLEGSLRPDGQGLIEASPLPEGSTSSVDRTNGTSRGSGRIHIIARPFQLLAPRVEMLFATNNRKARSAGAKEILSLFAPIHLLDVGEPTGALCASASVALLSTIFLPIGLMIIGGCVADRGQPIPWWSYTGALVCLVLGCFAVAGLQASFRRRMLRKEILPQLAKALQPLSPDAGELRIVLEAFSSLGFRIGSVFSPHQILNAMGK
jgi:hypothetical protein